MKNKRNSYPAMAKQQGIVLIVALVFLMIITLIGVSAAKRSGINNQISGNSMMTMLTYQGAESTMARSARDSTVLSAQINENNGEGAIYTVPNLADEDIGKGTLNSSATVQPESTFTNCPPTMIMSSTIKCKVYRIQATSQIQGTHAKAVHQMGYALTQAK